MAHSNGIHLTTKGRILNTIEIGDKNKPVAKVSESVTAKLAFIFFLLWDDIK
jgi:hypothetical protein